MNGASVHREAFGRGGAHLRLNQRPALGLLQRTAVLHRLANHTLALPDLTPDPRHGGGGGGDGGGDGDGLGGDGLGGDGLRVA